jgi:phosphatidylglycerol:prolipoprotein diacylglycerol transferase
LVVFLVSKKKQFEGQLFLIYIILYAIGRAINEHFRGDEDRGYLFGGLLSYSQFIAIVLIIISAAIWYKKSRNLNQEAIKADD